MKSLNLEFNDNYIRALAWCITLDKCDVPTFKLYSEVNFGHRK